MPVTDDILATYRAPRRVIRGKLADGPREDRALAVLMGACGLTFVAQWPGLSRAAHLDPSVPLDARMGAALLACIFVLPLVLYLLAGISHLIARAMGGQGSGYGSRLALFWAWLVTVPLALLHGLARGLIGDTTAVTLLGLAVLAAFLWLWITLLHEAHRP